MGDELSTTTVSDSSTFVKFVTCCCPLSSIPMSRFYLHNRSLPTTSTHPNCLRFSKERLDQAAKTRTIRDFKMLQSVTSLCRTPRLDVQFVAKCIPDSYKDVRELTCGGMSRIFSATSGHGTSSSNVVIKVTDCSRGLGMHEYDCYTLLAQNGFNIPTIDYVAKYGNTLIMILSRYAFSLSSLFFSLATTNSHNQGTNPRILDDIIECVCCLLNKLKERDIAYCDFSPDNIMVDIDTTTLCGKLVLIDPQFALPMSHLASKLGRHWAENIDRVHFAHKVRILALQDRRLSHISDTICTKFLGHVPSEKETTKWVLNVLPHGLRIAYDSIHNEAKNSPEERYGKQKRKRKQLERR